MEIKVQITQFPREDLVDFLSTALYHSATFVGRLIPEYKDLEKSDTEGEVCFEEAIANVLTYGGKFAVVDMDSEGETNGPRKGVSARVLNTGDVEYQFDLEAVKKGLEEAISSHDALLLESAMDFLKNDGSMDAIEADALLQFIVFGEVIYG